MVMIKPMFNGKLGVLRVVTSHQGFKRAFSIRVFVTRNVVPTVIQYYISIIHSLTNKFRKKPATLQHIFLAMNISTIGDKKEWGSKEGMPQHLGYNLETPVIICSISFLPRMDNRFAPNFPSINSNRHLYGNQ